MSKASPDLGQNSGAGRNPKTASSFVGWYSRSWAKASLYRSPNTAFLFFSPKLWGWGVQGAAATAEGRNVFHFRFFPSNLTCSFHHLLTTDQEQMLPCESQWHGPQSLSPGAAALGKAMSKTQHCSFQP